ncbi:MAG: hypothetical protein ACE149_14310 [Armatimonadota bacterium]
MNPVTPEIYRFRFDAHVPMECARDLAAYAILFAQGVHGSARVRLDCRYFADDRRRSVVVDARTKAGQTMAVFFTQLLLDEFGMSGFSVERVPKNDGFLGRGALGHAAVWFVACCRRAGRRVARAATAAH